MKGSEEVAQALNERLSEELAALHQYMMFSQCLKLHGLTKMARMFEDEIQDELGHATRLTHRILFLGYEPNVKALAPFDTSHDPKEMLTLFRDAEMDAINRYNETINICRQNSDAGSEEMLRNILLDEEHHLQAVEAALYQIDVMGLDQFLSVQTDGLGEPPGDVQDEQD